MFITQILHRSCKIRPPAIALFLILCLLHFSCVLYEVPGNDFGIKKISGGLMRIIKASILDNRYEYSLGR
jgi:hypothetical protein